MTPLSMPGTRPRRVGQGERAFTLIELLVVIAIIAIVATLIAGLATGAGKKKVTARGQALISELSMAIDGYKDEMGFYPPDNPNNPARPPLYYSLKGTRRLQQGNSPVFESTDGEILNEGQIKAAFGIEGFLNFVGAGAKPKDFYAHLKEDNVGKLGAAKYVVFPYKGPEGDWNPVHYNLSSPTHNPGSYDLWIDVVVGGKTNTIGNWRQ